MYQNSLSLLAANTMHWPKSSALAIVSLRRKPVSQKLPSQHKRRTKSPSQTSNSETKSIFDKQIPIQLNIVSILAMALSYPEGEVFFSHRGLNSSNSSYQADNPQHFYSHLMIEYVWNVEADHDSKNANSPKGHSHYRSDYGIVKGSSWSTHYGNWTHLPISYGGSSVNSIIRRTSHNLCQSGNRFKDHERGAHPPR